MVERAKIEAEKNAASTNVTGADLLKMMTQKHDTQEMNVIVKADVQGSLTSVMDSLRLVDTRRTNLLPLLAWSRVVFLASWSIVVEV